MSELEKNFDAKEAEPRIYKTWESSGYFQPENLPSSLDIRHSSFCIIMPPPNANGSLHIGHALFVTTQDIMIRYKRMQGFKTLWLPGADHAGFETQVVYTKKIEKEGRKFWEIPREQLYNEIKDFTLANKAHMEGQLRALGASCDWSREKFTLDEDIKGVVYDTFKKLYDDGLVYRGTRIINWCSRHQTSLSDLEITQPEVEDTFYYLQYGPFTIATARPETKFGDKYVVVHPKDERYSQYQHGQKFEVEWINGKITATLIKDESIDMSFGTGAMTITPWHDSADFEIAQRHNLPKEQIIDWQGKLLPVAGEFAGQHITKARPLIIEKLKAKGLLIKSEPYKHAVPACYKCNTPIEPQVRPQWFVAMTKGIRRWKLGVGGWKKKSLRDLAVDAVKKGEVNFVTERFKNDFLRWMENLRDWNISRQIVWGIRIPVWYCLMCGQEKINTSVDKQLFVLRHGETDWNVAKRMQGHTDNPLNDLGRRQAQEAGEKMKNSGIDMIFSSDLIRARETAEIIAKAIGAKVIVDTRLRERNFGKAEGAVFGETKKKFPTFWAFHSTDADSESYDAVEKRVWESIEEHTAKHSHKKLLFVGHGGTMRVFLRRIKNLAKEKFLESTGAPGMIPHAQAIGVDMAESCSKCGHHFYEQDPDVFDTWFSSGQWPFATLMTSGSSSKTLNVKRKTLDDFEQFYPTDVMETGWDILFFWVARMVMLGKYRTGKAPFKTVYLNGIVRDKDRQKMSKSKGNVIDPLGIAEQYGTDAVRMALISGNAPATDPIISEEKIKGFRNFTTKIWNMAKFLLEHADKHGSADTQMNTDSVILNGSEGSIDASAGPQHDTQAQNDKQVLTELAAVKKEVTGYLDEYKLHLAAETIYHYVWHTVADKIIEATKTKAVSPKVLLEVFRACLKMLHPFMPFVTEEIWGKLPIANKKLLMIEPW